MISKFFEEVFWEANLCESKKHLHNFTVKNDIAVKFGNKENYAILKAGAVVKCVNVIAEGTDIDVVERLRSNHKLQNGSTTNKKDWQKVVGNSKVVLQDGTELPAHIHWYQCANIGKVEFKISKWL